MKNVVDGLTSERLSSSNRSVVLTDEQVFSIGTTLYNASEKIEAYADLLDFLSEFVTLHFRKILVVSGAQVLSSYCSGVKIPRKSVVDEIERLHSQGYAVTAITF